MRISACLLFSAVLMASASAHAAMVWTETEDRGVPVIHWSMGANLNEAQAAAKASTGNQTYRLIQSCRQPGYFAFVGSDGQTQHGVSCGYETVQAALYAAHMECENEDGRCDIEKYGHDEGKALADNADAAGLPADLPGSSRSGGNVNMPAISLQEPQ